MSEDVALIECDNHGEGNATFVCRHLIADPVQEWFSGYPTEDNPWPDAWCEICNLVFLKEGGWTDTNEEKIQVQILCDGCYVEARSRSVERLRGEALDEWNTFARECCRSSQQRQEALFAEYQIGAHKHWNWDQDTGELVFSNDGVPALIASIEFIGSISTISNTWLWSWANFGLSENVRTLMEKVRDFGELKGYPRLTTPKWLAGEVDGWEMSSIAAHVLDARGLYRTPDETGFTFLAIMEIRFA